MKMREMLFDTNFAAGCSVHKLKETNLVISAKINKLINQYNFYGCHFFKWFNYFNIIFKVG